MQILISVRYGLHIDILIEALCVPEYKVFNSRTDELIQVWDIKPMRNNNNLSFMGKCIVTERTVFL